ncbi:MAG: hypothetical protein HW416_3655, partial [Chloroflexi bacterium]|nr:hypothetical protein [Chloroflexota bacterium]
AYITRPISSRRQYPRFRPWSWARSLVLVGCTVEEIFVPRVAVAECLAPTPRSHPRFDEYLQLLRPVTVLAASDSAVVQRATEFVDRYAAHGAQLADMLIASAALAHSYTLISTNWADFHFVEGLWLIDARYLHTPTRSPTILLHAKAPQCGPTLPPPRCCRGLVDAGVLPRMD